ncbi:calmodulin-binding transcription activator 6-like isoform X2 [Henckelia pumila]|uniref:calmodulin-binding transcription activator 6-like isoform X2 n=1 Tax=Henckelia pumila TaxID=405737 RepID=UPI003C6DCB79
MEAITPAGPGFFGSEIHGFRSMEDLDVGNMTEEAKGRWLRPNEIHAILCNHRYFTVHVKPVNLPTSGTIVLFDRKMLRNFRKDGHNWKKKKDGKTVKEAHEHLKVGNEERIHIYYAHGEDKPTFVRRCYWLLDKSLEHIVLVHYRETQELQGSQYVNSNSNSAASDPSASWLSLEESDSAFGRVQYGGRTSPLEFRDCLTTIKNHEQRLHEINTLEWDELLLPDHSRNILAPHNGKAAGFELTNQYEAKNCKISSNAISTNKAYPESSANSFFDQVSGPNSINYAFPSSELYQAAGCEKNVSLQTEGLRPLGEGVGLDDLGQDGLQAQDSFGRWMTNIIADSPGSADDQALEYSVLTVNQAFTSEVVDKQQTSSFRHIFNMTEVSPAWAVSTEETKILVVGFFTDGQVSHTNSNLFLVCGDSIISARVIQDGVIRCMVSPQKPGVVGLYLTFDGHNPISQVCTFEFRAPLVPKYEISSADRPNWEEFQLQIRLAHLLFSSSKDLGVSSTKPSQNALKEAKAFAQKTSHVSNGWMSLTKIVEDAKISFLQAKDSLFELTLQNRLQEWLLEKVVAGCKISERDKYGQGVIHLCAILGYTWAVYSFSCSSLSLDYRDKFGWTALHWAAYSGRETMVAALLSAGAKPNLVTDPTPENPGGCTAADLASKNGFDGLAAYLAEMALVAQLNDMTLAGNVSGSLLPTTSGTVNSENLSEDELNLKETLAAYRTAADAAARIQVALSEHSLKVRTKSIRSSNPEEARNIVAALKIQHAFRNHNRRKKMAAAARIQHRFRTFKTRKEFLNKRQNAIKIQAAFRGFQARRQYCKIVWSVGVLEKAILRWRLKRKGIRGIQIQPDETLKDPTQEGDVEEDFFQASRKQAEDRVERSVVRVQAMFRSKKAQEDYRRMKFVHKNASLQFKELLHPDLVMGHVKD